MNKRSFVRSTKWKPSTWKHRVW